MINEILKKRKISVTDTEMIAYEEQESIYRFNEHKEVKKAEEKPDTNAS